MRILVMRDKPRCIVILVGREIVDDLKLTPIRKTKR